jgi:hypothetical protein
MGSERKSRNHLSIIAVELWGDHSEDVDYGLNLVFV